MSNNFPLGKFCHHWNAWTLQIWYTRTIKKVFTEDECGNTEKKIMWCLKNLGNTGKMEKGYTVSLRKRFTCDSGRSLASNFGIHSSKSSRKDFEKNHENELWMHFQNISLKSVYWKHLEKHWFWTKAQWNKYLLHVHRMHPSLFLCLYYIYWCSFTWKCNFQNAFAVPSPLLYQICLSQSVFLLYTISIYNF